MNVMSKAWKIAKEGAKKFGGKAVEYFVEALRMAWKIIKKGVDKVKVSKWVTAKGTKVEMYTEHVTERNIGTDDWTGNPIMKKVDEIKIVKMIVNGMEYASVMADRSIEQGIRTINMGRQIVNGRKIIMNIALPADIEQDVWGAYEERKKKWEAAVKKANKVGRAYCNKCGSYCYGDCEAN